MAEAHSNTGEKNIYFIAEKKAYRVSVTLTRKGKRSSFNKLLPKRTTLAEAKAIRDNFISEATAEIYGLTDRSVTDWRQMVTVSAQSKVSWVAQLYKGVRARAISKKHPEYITFDEFIELLLGSAGKCAITGLTFSPDRIKGINKRPMMPSIDRIDSSNGYLKENCRVVCAAVNLAMMDWGEDLFKALAIGYVKNQLLDPAINSIKVEEMTCLT